MPQARVGLLRQRIDELVDRHYVREQDAFVHAAVELLWALDETEALGACIGDHDREIDAFYMDEENGNLHVLQGKMCTGRRRVPPGDITYFSTAVDWLEDPASLNQRGANPGVVRAAQLFSERVATGEWDTQLWIATTNGFEPAAEQEIHKYNRDNQRLRRVMHPIALPELEELYRQTFQPTAHVGRISFSVDPAQVFGPVEGDSPKAVVATIRGDELGSEFNLYHEQLIDANVRGWLTKRARANRRMEATIKDYPRHFWYLNNGITFVCGGVDLNNERTMLTVERPQIVNGGQTSRTLANNRSEATDVRVLARFIVSEDEDFRREIADGTNTQSAVGNRDLRSIDAIRRRLEEELRRGSPSYYYLRKRGEIAAQVRRTYRDRIMPMWIAAQALASVYHQIPGTARGKVDDLFNSQSRWYDVLFHDDLRGHDVLFAWHIYEEAAKVRKELAAQQPESREVAEAVDSLARYGLMCLAAFAGDLIRGSLGQLDHGAVDRLLRADTQRIARLSLDASVRALRTRLMAQETERREFDNLTKLDSSYSTIKTASKAFLESVDPAWEARLRSEIQAMV